MDTQQHTPGDYNTAAIAHVMAKMADDAKAQIAELKAQGKGGENLQVLLLQLVTTLLLGGSVSESYKPPTIEKTQTFSLFGHTNVLTEKGSGEVSVSLTSS